MHNCDRVSRTVHAVEALRTGIDPYDGTQLLTRPRKICKRDVGTHQWSGEGRPDDNLATFSEVNGDAPSAALGVLTSQHADEDDPLGLGVGLG